MNMYKQLGIFFVFLLLILSISSVFVSGKSVEKAIGTIGENNGAQEYWFLKNSEVPVIATKLVDASARG